VGDVQAGPAAAFEQVRGTADHRAGGRLESRRSEVVALEIDQEEERLQRA
jgi:hypothetical protein